MVRLENVLKISLQDVLKMSWKHLEDVFKRSWRRLEVALKRSWRRFQDVFKMSWWRLEKVLKTSWRHMAKTNILVLTKTSSEDVRLRRRYSSWWRRLEDVFKTSSEDKDERRLQEVFIKANVCWDVFPICDECLTAR